MSARTILNPPIINELNGLFDGSGTIDTENISCAKLSLTGNTPGYVTSLTTDLANSVNINVPLNGGITFNATNITVPDASIFLDSSAGVSSLSCTTAFTVPTLNMVSSAGDPVCTLGNALNGVLGITNTDTESAAPSLVVQLINGNDVFCNLGVGASQDILQVGSSGSGTVSCSTVSLTGNTPGYDTSITTDLANSVNINVPLDGGITFKATNTSVPDASIFLESSAGVSSLSCTTNFSALTFSGGIGCVYQSIAIPALNPAGNYTLPITIPNFIGSANTAYVASLNNSSDVSIFSTVGATYSGLSGTGTIVTVVITCTTGGTVGAYTADVNIIAMNLV
jgi:hypothetical protein